MQSLFNTEFNKFLSEGVVVNTGTTGSTNSNNTNSTNSNNTNSTNSNNTDSTNPNTTDSTNSNNTDSTSAFNNFKTTIKDAIATAMNITPEVAKNLQAKAAFWAGEAGNGMDLLIQAFNNYNDKKRENALYGTIDYLKAKNPILVVEPNNVTKLVDQTILNNETQ